mmetsp:Transcript_8462/g.31323  ORF Transcript_8462/g.31323 Transcript_8462/m.31323 type:complete len:472 (+) Transcript_8462:1300-2715(+)
MEAVLSILRNRTTITHTPTMSSPNDDHDFFRQVSPNDQNDDLMFMSDNAGEEATARTQSPDSTANIQRKHPFLKTTHRSHLPFLARGANAVTNSTSKEQKSPANAQTQPLNDSHPVVEQANSSHPVASLDLDELEESPDTDSLLTDTPDTTRTPFQRSPIVESSQKDDNTPPALKESHSQRAIVQRKPQEQNSSSPRSKKCQSVSLLSPTIQNFAPSARAAPAPTTSPNQASTTQRPLFCDTSPAERQMRPSSTPPSSASTRTAHEGSLSVSNNSRARTPTRKFQFSLSNRGVVRQSTRHIIPPHKGASTPDQGISERIPPDATPSRFMPPPPLAMPPGEVLPIHPPSRNTVEEEGLYKKEQQELEIIAGKEKEAASLMNQIDTEMVSSKQMHNDTNSKLLNLSHKLSINLDPTNEVLVKLQAGNALRQHMILNMLLLEEEMGQLQSALSEIENGQSAEEIQNALGCFRGE